jgi:NACHT domain-containing protein
MRHRDDFSLATKQALAERVGYLCSNPECAKPTIGPSNESPTARSRIGVACHITAAASGPGARRYDPAMSSSERRSISNGIWLCETCAKLIDTDAATYPPTRLREWREQAEADAHAALTHESRWAGALRKYADVVIEEFSFVGLPLMFEKRISIKDVVPAMIMSGRRSNGPHSELSAHDEKGGVDREMTRQTLSTAVDANQRLVIVGAGGSGKTTALRKLAYDTAQRFLDRSIATKDLDSAVLAPVLVYLRGFTGGLLAHVQRALSLRGYEMTIQQTSTFLRQGSALFMFDGFDECHDPHAFSQELGELFSMYPRLYCIVSTRETSRIRLLPPMPQVVLDGMNFAESTLLLSKILGAERGFALAERIINDGMSDVSLERPLLTWMIAAAADQIERCGSDVSTAALFRTVIDEQWLGRWEAKHTDASSAAMARQMEAKLSLLQCLGLCAVRTSSREVLEAEVINIFLNDPNRPIFDNSKSFVAQLLDELALAGIITRANGRVWFWHRSFEDYFCGVWLSRRASDFRLTALGWLVHWHGALLFAVALLPQTRAERIVKSFLTGTVPLSSYMITRIGPARLFLFLRSCIEGGRKFESLVVKLIESLKAVDHLWLQPTSEQYHGSQYRDEALYAEFCALLARTRSPAVGPYLRHAKLPDRSRFRGLFFLHDRGVFEELLDLLTAVPKMFTGMFHGSATEVAWEISSLMMTSTSPAERQRVISFLEKISSRDRRRVLHHFTMGAAQVSHDKNPALLDEYRRRWESEFIRLTLDFEDPRDSSDALSVVRNLWRGAGLSPESQQVFIDAALHGDGMYIRRNAVHAFAYVVPSEVVLPMVRTIALRDAYMSVVNEALWVIRLHSLESLAATLAGVIRRLLNAEILDANVWRSIYCSAPHGPAQSRWRVMTLLFLAVATAEIPLHRGYAALALQFVAPAAAVDFLQNAWSQEHNDWVKSQMLITLTSLLGISAERYLLEALECRDSSPELFSIACSLLHNNDALEPTVRRAGRLLYEIAIGLKTIGASTRYNAAKALAKVGYMSPDFIPGLADNAEYLGPSEHLVA